VNDPSSFGVDKAVMRPWRKSKSSSNNGDRKEAIRFCRRGLMVSCSSCTYHIFLLPLKVVGLEHDWVTVLAGSLEFCQGCAQTGF
jgi:hypothetical protein